MNWLVCLHVIAGTLKEFPLPGLVSRVQANELVTFMDKVAVLRYNNVGPGQIEISVWCLREWDHFRVVSVGPVSATYKGMLDNRQCCLNHKRTNIPC